MPEILSKITISSQTILTLRQNESCDTFNSVAFLLTASLTMIILTRSFDWHRSNNKKHRRKLMAFFFIFCSRLFFVFLRRLSLVLISYYKKCLRVKNRHSLLEIAVGFKYKGDHYCKTVNIQRYTTISRLITGSMELSISEVDHYLYGLPIGNIIYCKLESAAGVIFSGSG